MIRERKRHNARRSAGLELHAVHDELDRERVSMLWHQRLLELSLSVHLSGIDVVVVGLGHVGRREERVGEAVLGDQVLGHDEQELSPDFSNGVDTEV